MSPAFAGAPGNWHSSSWLPGRDSAGMLVQYFPGFALSVLPSSFSAGPPRVISDENKSPAPGYPLCVAAGSGTTPGAHLASPPGVPAACCGSGINYLNHTTHTQSPCTEELARANVPPMFGGDFLNHRQILKEVLHHPDSKRRGLTQKPMQSSMQACASGNHSAWSAAYGMQPDVLLHLLHFA